MRERSPPHHSRQQSGLRNNEDEGESRIRGSRRNDPPPSLHGDNYERGPLNDDDRLGNLNVHDLRRMLVQVEEEKRLPLTILPRAPFSRVISESPPLVNIRHHLGLTFNGVGSASKLARESPSAAS